MATCPEARLFEAPAQQESACALVAQPSSTAQADRAALSRLLDEPEFSRVRRKNGSVLALLWERLVAWLKAFFETEGAASFAKAVPFAVLSLAFAAVLFAALRLWRGRSPKGPAAQTPSLSESPLALEPPERHLERARALLDGAPREAIREGLLALLSSLERRQLARPDRVKTNRELCLELPTRGADATLTQKVTAQLRWFDGAFYSLAPVQTAEARAFIDEMAQLAGAPR